MEWCQATGKAHHTSAPRIAWPSVNGRMFRAVPKSQAIATPPTNVSGTNTGFGQCNAAKITPATTAADRGFSNARSRRFITNEFSPTCCNRQNAM